MKNFLVFNTSFFGDTLLTGPLCQSLKLAHENAKIYFVVNEPFVEAARYMKGVDAVIPYDKKGRHKGVVGAWSFYREQKRRLPEIDAAFVIYGNERNILLARLLGARRIYADNAGPLKALLDNGKLEYGSHIHAQDKNTFLGTLYTGAEFCALPMRYTPPPAAVNVADVLLRERSIADGAKLTALCTTSKRVDKDMPVDECARLIGLLADSGRAPVLVGAGATAVRYRDELFDKCKAPFVDLTNKTSIAELAAVLQRCRGMISVDTGTLHLGLAVGTPAVAVYYLNEASHLAAWAPKELYKHALMAGPDYSAETMLRNLQTIEKADENA